MKNDDIVVGAYLSTLDGRIRSNAIVTDVDGDSVEILTDFGNILNHKKSEVLSFYEVSPSWLEANYCGYPLPSISERVEEQIELLKGFLEINKNKA